jgi:hypothetical protein
MMIGPLSRLALIVVGVCLFAAAAAAALNPAALVLHQADVPPGFRLDRGASGLRSNEFERQETPELRGRIAAWGRVTGYQVEFDRGDSSLMSRADVLRDSEAAQAMLRWYVRELKTAPAQAVIRPVGFRLGDEARSYGLTFGGESLTVVVWRFRQIFALVA